MPGISDETVAGLHRRVGTRCGYCRTSSRLTGQGLTVEHIIPLARGGSSSEENLWLSCRRCNEFKGAKVEAVDPVTGVSVSLFDPHRQIWREHFRWAGDGSRIEGLTPSGRATVAVLRMNDPES